jgi:hypothetical protein
MLSANGDMYEVSAQDVLAVCNFSGAKARHFLFRLRHDLSRALTLLEAPREFFRRLSSRALTFMAALLELFLVREAAPFQERAIDRIQLFVTPGTL